MNRVGHNTSERVSLTLSSLSFSKPRKQMLTLSLSIPNPSESLSGTDSENGQQSKRTHDIGSKRSAANAESRVPDTTSG